MKIFHTNGHNLNYKTLRTSLSHSIQKELVMPHHKKQIKLRKQNFKEDEASKDPFSNQLLIRIKSFNEDLFTSSNNEYMYPCRSP